MSGTILGALQVLIHLVLTSALWGRCCYNPHLIVGETEAQSGEETYSRLVRKKNLSRHPCLGDTYEHTFRCGFIPL